MAHTAIKEEEKPIKRFLSTLHQIYKQNPSWATLKSHLSKHHSQISGQFSRVDLDGFKTVGREPFDIWLDSTKDPNAIKSGQTIQQLVATATRNVHAVVPGDRSRLVKWWVAEMQTEIVDE